VEDVGRQVPREQRPDHHGEQAEVQLRRAEARVVAGDREVAGRREAEPAAQRVARHRRKDRHGGANDRVQQVRVRARRRLPGEHPTIREPLAAEVAAGAEPTARPAQNDATDLRVVCGRRDGGREPSDQRGRERIAALGAVEGEGEGAPRPGDEQGSVHGAAG
jgi:hypothetical protein